MKKDFCDNNHHCEMFKSFNLLCKKWALMILHTLSEKKKARFSDFQQDMPKINSRALSQRLTDLEDHGFITRTVRDGKPVSIHYELTKKAKDLQPIFKAIHKWHKNWQ